MAKRELKSLGELPEPEPIGTESLEETIERHEHKIDTIDKVKIDAILLSEDVQKGGKIRITRKGPLDRDYQYVTTVPAESWQGEEMLEWAKKMYGGGDYKCQTFRANGQMYKPFEFVIDYRVKGKLDDDDIARMANQKDAMALKVLEAANRPQPSDGLKSSDFMKMMEMSNSKSDETMKLVMMMMMESQKTMATMMAAAISSGNKQTGIDPVLLDLIKTKQDRPPMMEMLEMMQALKDFNREEPKEEKEEGMFEKIMKFAPMLIPALSGGQPQAPATNGHASPVVTTSPPAQPEQPNALPPDGLVSVFPIHIRMFVASLVKAAERQSDPGLYADMIVDQLDGTQEFTALRQILTESDWKVKLWGDETKVAHIGPWLEELRRLILDDSNASIPTDTSPATGAPVSNPGQPA